GVVVEQRDMVGLGPAREGERVVQRRVPPPALADVLLRRVLGVVDQQRRVPRQRQTRDGLARVALEVLTERGLVVGNVGKHRPPSVTRYPSVGPRWLTSAASISAEPRRK